MCKEENVDKTSQNYLSWDMLFHHIKVNLSNVMVSLYSVVIGSVTVHNELMTLTAKCHPDTIPDSLSGMASSW